MSQERWWSPFLVRVTNVQLEVIGEPQTVRAQTYLLPLDRTEAAKSWRAETYIPVAEVAVAAFGPTEVEALQSLRAEVEKTWEIRIQKQREHPPALANGLSVASQDDIHLNEPWLSVHWDRQRNTVHAHFKGFAKSDEFRAGTLKILEAIRERKAAALVSDNRALEGVSDKDQLWLRDVWVPEAVTAGVRRIAVILAHHGPGKVASQEIISKFGNTEFATRTFESLDEGMAWAAGEKS